AAFGSDLDEATQKQLTRGERLVELLKQPQYQPLPMEKQVTALYAGTKGYMDAYPKEAVAKYEEVLYPFVENRFPEVFSGLKEKQEITSDIEAKLKECLAAYDEEFKETV
ncbi:MAG: F0F1 ATP synthase subunit alpha, partial [Desulfobacterales bacterium]|nr:F0F1 ATP synthase subunit alpha [Desulfobacterales bacterium]